MTDELSAFRGDRADDTAEEQVLERRDLLLFELDGALYGVRARDVTNVIAWRPPAPVPQGGPHVLGLVQDAGRVVVVVTHPASLSTEPPAQPSRIVLCDTRQGLIGLPATTARSVEPVGLKTSPAHGELFDTPAGAAVYVEPTRVAETLVGSRT